MRLPKYITNVVQINECKFKLTLIDIGFFSKQPKNETKIIIETIFKGIINISENYYVYSVLVKKSPKHPEFSEFVMKPSKLEKINLMKIIEIKKEA